MLTYFENVKTAIKELSDKGFAEYLLGEMRDYWVDPLNGDYVGSIGNLRTKILSVINLNKGASYCILIEKEDAVAQSVVYSCDLLIAKI